MDINKINNIKNNTDLIRKFRQLDKYKLMSNDEFEKEIKNIMPDFCKNNLNIVKLVIENKDLQYLDMIFNNINKVNNEYENTKYNIDIIRPIIEYCKDILSSKPLNENELRKIVDKKYPEFSKKYPIIIKNLCDKNIVNKEPEHLYLDHVKFKYEVNMGEIFAKRYLYPKINK